MKNHGRCSVFVDGEFFAACPIDVAVALGLKKGLEISPELEKRLRSEDRRVVLRQKAYRFATYKPRTEQQVRQRLVDLEATADEIEAVVTWLKEFNVVGDANYVVRFLEATHERKPLSPAAARRVLLQRGIDKYLVEDTLAKQFSDELVLQLATQVAEKKLRMLKAAPLDVHKQQLIKFLQYRGYPWSIIKDVVDHLIIIILAAISIALVHTPLTAQGILSCQRTRLPLAINDYQPTTQPVLAPDGSLYLDRKLHPLNEGGPKDPDDVWISQARGHGDWSEPTRKMFTVFRRPDVMFNFTLDGLHALVVGSYQPSGQDTIPCFAILHRRTVSTHFDSVEILSVPNVPMLGRNFYGHISDDLHILIVALERAVGSGELDLYVSQRCSQGWSDPVSLGQTINSSGIEGAPWLSHDTRRLYFSSNGRDDRKGKSDLYTSKRLDDSWTSWSTPKNLGSCVNTVEDETSFSLVGRGDSALITSWDAEFGRPGIYMVVLDPDHRPDPFTVFVSSIRDAVSDSVVSRAAVEIENASRPAECSAIYVADAKTGIVTFPLAQNEKYRVQTSATGYIPHQQTIGVHNLDSTVDLRLTTRLFNTNVPLISLYFEKGSFVLDESQYQNLREVIGKYDVRQIRFDVIGFTDPLGTLPLNQKLSLRRADHIRDKLSEIGIPRDRIVAKGQGIEQIPSSLETERPESRRVDVFPAP